MRSAKEQLAEVKAWRARFTVHPELAGLSRYAFALEIDPESDLGPVPVYQHTLDDYDFLLGELERVTKECAALSSAQHRDRNRQDFESGLTHFRAEASKLGHGINKYREQHQLDKKYILGLKAEIRRLKALLPPDIPLEVMGIRSPGCPNCGCPDPAMDHAKAAAEAAKWKGRLDKIRAKHEIVVLKLKKAVGQQRREGAGA